MAKIGLIDVDGHNFPNLALMKISNYHKQNGDSVEWYNGIEFYDIVYMSKVFTFTTDENRVIQADLLVKGGTGYDVKVKLPIEIEAQTPDYSIYPKFTEAYGFLTRGCIRRCSWCIVPKKEGYIQQYNDIEYVLQGRREAILMDNNILACDYGLKQLEKIVDLKCIVDFNQGLDARLVTDEIAILLSKIKWIRYIRFACDTKSAIDPVIRATELLNKYGIKNYKIFVYCLVTEDLRDAYDRVMLLDYIGAVPFAQPYRSFEYGYIVPEAQRSFARWVNHKATFNSCTWDDYKYNNKLTNN